MSSSHPSTYVQFQTRHSLSHKSSSSSSSSSTSSTSGSSNHSDSAYSSSPRRSMDTTQVRVSVETMRCSRCAKSVETIVSSRGRDGKSKVSSEDALAGGMVRFGHNLYYCDRCARMVGYK